MEKNITSRLLFIVAVFIGLNTANAQLRLPQLSPTTKVVQNFGVSEITLDYSRPSLRGRVFGEGDLNYYGKFWRTGANSATTITFGSDVTLNGQKLAAGKYGLYSFPDKNEWTVVFSKNTNVNDQANYKQEDDAVRLKVKSEAHAHTETFTIDFNDFTANSTTIKLKWDKIVVPIKAELDVKALAYTNIDKEIDKMWNSLAQAANYALESNDVEKGKKWIDQSLALEEHYWNLLVKSKYLAKEGDYAAAVKTAEKSLDMAKEAKINFYVTQNEKNIAEWTPKITVSKGKKKS